MAPDEIAVLEHRINEAEADIERLFDRTKDVVVLMAEISALRSDIKELREENTRQHTEGSDDMKQLRKDVNERITTSEGRILTAAIAIAGVFGAGLVGVLARGLG